MAENTTSSGINIPAIKLFTSSAMKRSDIMFALGFVGILTVLILPIPTMLLDFLLAISITISVLILMTVLFVDKPLNLSSFPTILLISTMLRLSLNIASTRLILGHGHEGSNAAGRVIEAFGGFVMGGSIVIGAIIFSILTIINFVVITKGSGRIAEVSARFSLDAMPGKQMAIDADLSAGLVDEDTAKSRRKELEDESTFFGAMDGASKFVRGDAIAGLMITFINLIAGIIIGVAINDLTFSAAIQTYTMLTIGDGLVSQIPSLIVSTAAGLLVTKAGVSGSADKAVIGQLGKFPAALGVTAFLLASIAFMPGIPAFPFLGLSAAATFVAWYVIKTMKNEILIESGGKTGVNGGGGATIINSDGTTASESTTDENTNQELAQALKLDVLRLELGYGLLSLINYEKGHRLTEQIKALRKQIARELGFVMPAVRIQDNMQLEANSYVVKVKEIETARGDIRPDMLLVMNPSGDKISLSGEETTEPTFGLPAMWINENQREEALFRNFTVVDPPTVITTHLTEIIKENVAELLSYTETQKLLDDMGEDEQKLIAETIPSQITVSTVQKILQNLLAEMVSIRDLSTIIEAVSESAKITQNAAIITEFVRTRLARQISYSVANDDGYVPIISMSPPWEQIFVESLSGEGEDKNLNLPPSKIQEFIIGVRKVFEEQNLKGELPVLLTSPIIRPFVRAMIERFNPTIKVLSQNEIHSRIKIKTLGQI